MLSAAVPGYDDLIARNEAAFTAGSITVTVIQTAVMIIGTAGAGAGVAVGLVALKMAAKTAIKAVVKSGEGVGSRIAGDFLPAIRRVVADDRGSIPLGPAGRPGDKLYRFGTEPESAERLGSQAANAESNGLPHGVSVRDATNRSDASVALRAEVEQFFSVIKTGGPHHYTVELPSPVTNEVATIFSRLFGRQ